MNNILHIYTTFVYNLIKNNINIDKKDFYSNSIPQLTIEYYINRILRYMYIENKEEEYYVMIFSMEYINRLREHVSIDKISIYNIIMTCILVSYKFLCDDTYSNKYCALIGGMSLQELNQFEILLLKILDWDLNVEISSL